MATATKKKPKQAPNVSARNTARPRVERSAKQKSTASGAPDRSAPSMAEVDAEALEFIEAIDRFKKQHGRPFPSWSEVLMVLRQLGYSRH